MAQSFKRAPILALLVFAAILIGCSRPAPIATGLSAKPFRPPTAAVSLSYWAPEARRVWVAGNFNAWAHNVGGRPNDDGALMAKAVDGSWQFELRDTPSVVRYKFVTEDAQGRIEWHADPGAGEHDADGNSVLLRGEIAGDVRPAADTPGMIEVREQHGQGSLIAVLRDPPAGAHRGAFRDTVEIPKLTVDGQPQQLFLRSWPDAEFTRYRSADVEVRFDSLGSRAVAIEWRPRRPGIHKFEVAIADNSRYYGGGERFNALNQKGVVLSMASLDRPEDKGTCSYKPVPFFISSRGYGMWLDSTSPSTFDLNATSREFVRISDTNDHLRLVLIAGPTPAEILAEFTRLTGRPTVPPAWAFAPWKSRDVHRNRDQVLADAELSRKHHLPASVIVLDSPWESSYNDFNLNQRQFERPAEMFARLRELGFVPCLWLTPFINNSNVTDMKGINPGPSPNFQEAADKGYLVKNADGSPMIVPWWKGTGGLVDFTNPAATAWWHEQLSKTLQWGVAAIKCDDGESNFVAGAKFFDGSNSADMKGRYAQLYLKAAHDFLEAYRPGDNALISRCGFTGTGQYPFGWAGDNQATWSFDNGLPGVILAAQNAALSGQPFWGCDIAGYIGDASPELFIRWTQFAAFTPLMMVHMQSNKGPWDYGDKALDIYRTFAKLHTRLYPYINAAAHEATEKGMPIIRPMVLAFPGDAPAVEQRYQYMFGPDLLVAPIYQGGTHRTVYLPKGAWIDFWTRERRTGPAMVEADAPLERMPLFVRAGAKIPMLPEEIDTLLTATPQPDPSVHPLDERRVVEQWPE